MLITRFYSLICWCGCKSSINGVGFADSIQYFSVYLTKPPLCKYILITKDMYLIFIST